MNWQVLPACFRSVVGVGRHIVMEQRNGVLVRADRIARICADARQGNRQRDAVLEPVDGYQIRRSSISRDPAGHVVPTDSN